MLLHLNKLHCFALEGRRTVQTSLTSDLISCAYLTSIRVGYVTTTKIKLILIVEDEAVPDAEVQKNVDDEIKLLLVKIHELYVADLMNPFKGIGEPIVSKRFEDRIQKYVAAFNQTDGMI